MDEVKHHLRHLAAVNPRLARRAWQYYLASDAAERRDAAALLDILADRHVGKDYRCRILLDPPPQDECAGTYPVGTVQYPASTPYGAFGLREDEWTKHVLITGMTGMGKTTLAHHLLRGLARHGKAFLVFDWKRSYRALPRLVPDTRVFSVARAEAPFHFNPLLPPPGTPPGEWLMQLVDVLKHAYFVGEGVEYLLRRAIDACYEHSSATPTFLWVREHVRRQRLAGRMSLWKASALRVLESLCFRHGLGPVVNTSTSLSTGFFRERVVLELDALADADKTFLTEALILWLYHHRRHTPGPFTHALLIEEAHHVLSHQKERAAGAETIMETCLRQIREYGEALIAIDQEPSKLSNSIKANTATKITFNLGNGTDITDMSRCMHLTPDESSTIKLLGIGNALLTLKNRAPTPVHISFPQVNPSVPDTTTSRIRKL